MKCAVWVHALAARLFKMQENAKTEDGMKLARANTNTRTDRAVPTTTTATKENEAKNNNNKSYKNATNQIKEFHFNMYTYLWIEFISDTTIH